MTFNKLDLARDLHERYAEVLAKQYGAVNTDDVMPVFEMRRFAAQTFWRSIAAAMIDHSTVQESNRTLAKYGRALRV